jgi:UDP-2,3-diacylglucosamine pyrophosphatase LpxH
VLTDGELCAIYPLGDPHIGMLSWHCETGEDFDLAIAERDLCTAIDALVARTPDADLAYLVNVGDFFHADDERRVTPKSGHRLDVDGRKGKVARVGFRIMRSLIDRLLEKHRTVRVINARGNHDPEMAMMLALWLEAVYSDEPRVEVLGSDSPYIYFRFGANLVGVHHGDGAKMEALPQVMATDRAKDWGDTEYRYWVTGHIHTQTRKEFPGCIVESFRTLAAADYWTHSMGSRSGRSLQAMVLHERYGEFARFTVDLAQVRAAQRGER